MAGQVIYHLLAAVGAHPGAVTGGGAVSCMPVVTLGFGAALTHLLRTPAPGAVSAVPVPYLNGSGVLPAEAEPFAAELARGEVLGIRRIRAELHVGQPKTQEIQARLSALAHTH